MVFHTGQLLIAAPALVDPNFAGVVIFVLDHDEDGALGVVINRPSELPLVAVLPSWAGAVSEPSLLFAGGPVAQDSALAIGLSMGAGPRTGFKQLIGEYGLVNLDTAPTDMTPDLAGVRVFSGYAGWSPGQLEAEITEGSWYVVGAMARDLVDPEPAHLWRTVLRRQPGELAYLSTLPDDPTMN